MRRGSTPTITLNIFDLDLTNVDIVQVTLKQDDIEIVKNNSDIKFNTDNTELSFKLTQEDSLSFHVGKAKVQCKFKFKDGSVIVSKITEFTINETLNGSIL